MAIQSRSTSRGVDVVADADTADVPSSAAEEEIPLAARGRRMGRPRGPERVPLTVRILAEHDVRLTAEVELQGLSPQYLVERALTDYFARLNRLRGRRP